MDPMSNLHDAIINGGFQVKDEDGAIKPPVLALYRSLDYEQFEDEYINDANTYLKRSDELCGKLQIDDLLAAMKLANPEWVEKIETEWDLCGCI